MDARVDNKTLRESTPRDVVDYLRRLLSRVDKKTLSDHLLASVSADSLPPRLVSLWLRSLADDASIVAALRMESSVSIRTVAIKEFGKRLRSSQVSQVWQAVGGTAGLLHIFTELSVDDVYHLCRVISRSSTTVIDKDVRRQYLTQLVKALVSDHFPDSMLKNPETRPLLKYYCSIVPACTQELVQEWHQKSDLPHLDESEHGRKRLYEAHPALCQSECLQDLTLNKTKDSRLGRYRMLLQSQPSAHAAEHMSASMEFALRVLRKLDANAVVNLEVRDVLDGLVYPLLRRLRRHRSSTALQREVVEIAMRWIKGEPQAIEHLSLDCTLLGHAIHLWDRMPGKHDDILLSLLRMIPAHRSSLAIVSDLLVRVYHRWQFLRLTLLNLARFRTDIDKDEDLKKMEDAWPVEIFFSLPSQHSLALLDRLIRQKPAGDFLVWSSNYIFAIDHRNDPSVLRILLLRGTDEGIEVAQNAIAKRKKSASTSREQEDRAFWAKSAIFCAISSGSRDLYEATLLWARRYNKDALTVKELYSAKILWTEDALNLLSGIPQQFSDRLIHEEDVADRVKHGNRIMMLLLETACQALREPSFRQPDWGAVFGLFHSVISTRFDGSERLAKGLHLSDQQLYDVVWRSTLDTLLDAETIGLQDGNKELNFRQANGPLRYSPMLFVHAKHHPSVFRFVDELARRRNELWEIRRRTLHPAVVTLQEPWTRGLPIQALLSLAIESSGYVGNMPFLLSRAKSVVFVDPKVALQKLPVDAETRDAIGSFVDDFGVALRLYVNGNSTVDDKTCKIQLAWDYVVNELTGDRMDHFEAVQFWRRVFRRSDIQPPVSDEPMPKRPDPILPEVDDPEEPTEWNPDPQPERWTRYSRELESTRLDYLLQPQGTGFLEENSAFWPKSPSTVQVVQPAYWDMYVYPKSIRPGSREALLAAAILHINSKRCAQHRILARPFPDARDARFPTLFLDQDFLDRKEIRNDFGELVLGRLLLDAPPSLLLSLCETMLAILQDSQHTPPDFEKATFSLLKLLIKSDRPHIALGMLRRIIVERPNDSSWHRYLLTFGVLDSLPPEVGKNFFLRLVSDVQAKLKEQAERMHESADSKEALTPSGPTVKVTTVKMIAQLMYGAEFVDERFAVDTLIGLFSNVRHLDIRVAIIESLTAILVQTRDEQLQATILDSLEQHAVPVAVTLNERNIMAQEDWMKAESEGEIPDVYQPDSIAMPPVLQALFNALGRVPASLTQIIIDRIMLPILKLSAQSNRRWTDLFLRVNNLVLPPDYLPSVPVKPILMANLVQHHIEHIPSSMLELWARATLVNLQPSKQLVTVNSAVLESSTLRSSNSGKHWLSLWGHEGIEALSYSRVTISSLLRRDLKPYIPGGITRGQVQAVVMDLAKALVLRCDHTGGELEYLLNFLGPSHRKNEEYQLLWRKNCRPVVESILSLIAHLRTSQWSRDPDREPSILPDTYKYSLWLLTLANMPWTSDHQARLGIYAHELTVEIQRLANSTQPYHHHYQLLKESALTLRPVDFCYLACRLGSLGLPEDREVAYADLLGIELADDLLRAAEMPKDSSFAEDARDLLASWRSCEVESVRMRGLRTTRILSGQKSGVKAWFVQN